MADTSPEAEEPRKRELDMACLPIGMPPENPEDLFEWLWRLREYEDCIFIRVYRNKEWMNVSLKEAKPQEWAAFTSRALEKGMLPVRVKRDSELKPKYPVQKDT
ncbi:MAG: hypothetical protein E6Q68_07225 [Polynucleobacter sp.]|nr:MAG: hypothetical protein E6Q68_07225 [Polynucleobacter sp.]